MYWKRRTKLMLTKMFNWLQNTTLSGDRNAMPATGYYGFGSTGNEITGLANSSKPQYETMKAVLYLGIR